jgi:AcrR family transcriptional regulator
MTLTRAQIVSSALELVAESGLQSLSMRSVAARVNATPMALYRHVRDKEDLEDAILDLVLGQLVSPVGNQVWHERLRSLARAGRRMIRDNPAIASLIQTRASRYTGAVSFVDAIYLTLLDAGVPAAQVPRLERLTTTFTLGFAASEANGRFAADTVRSDRGTGFPGHEHIALTLAVAPDWDAEFEADLDDLVAIIETHLSPRRDF